MWTSNVVLSSKLGKPPTYISLWLHSGVKRKNVIFYYYSHMPLSILTLIRLPLVIFHVTVKVLPFSAQFLFVYIHAEADLVNIRLWVMLLCQIFLYFQRLRHYITILMSFSILLILGFLNYLGIEATLSHFPLKIHCMDGLLQNYQSR